MNKRVGLLFVLFSAACGLSAAWAQAPESTQEGEPASGQATGKESVVAQEEIEKVVLSPWRVGDAKTEERKRKLEERRARVLRKAEKKKRERAHRKKKAQEEAARKKEEGDQFFPTDY